VGLGGEPPGARKELTLADWLWSIALYTSVIFALVGAAGMIRPLRRVHRGRRSHAFVMFVIGAAVAYAISWSMPRVRTSGEQHGIDAFTPEFHFRERHETTIAAPPARVFDAVRTVTASEIALFQTFTWLRRFGQAGPESIMNAPEHRPILDVATSTSFLLLHDRPPHEVVVGTVVVAPPGTIRTPEFGVEHFKLLTSPGFATATMNFRIEDAGEGRSRLITETRVFATDPTALGRFTTYWRIIFPGSAILRVTWLRAIKARAERAS
jgi:hypothetical protein